MKKALVSKGIFLRLHMRVYLRTKFSSLILTSFRQGVILLPPLPQNEPLKGPSRLGLKPSSYLISVFCRDPINPSNASFPNINFTKTMTNLVVVSKITEKCCNILYLLAKVFQRS